MNAPSTVLSMETVFHEAAQENEFKRVVSHIRNQELFNVRQAATRSGPAPQATKDVLLHRNERKAGGGFSSQL
jgi:hypothetical protein